MDVFCKNLSTTYNANHRQLTCLHLSFNSIMTGMVSNIRVCMYLELLSSVRNLVQDLIGVVHYKCQNKIY